MKKYSIIFWITTSLFGAFMVFSSIGEIQQTQAAKSFIQAMGYPAYINPFLGILKVLGVAAIMVPGFPRLKEWAYAGLFFDLLGATYSQIAVAGFKIEITFMALPIALLFISYYTYHKKTKNSNVPVL